MDDWEIKHEALKKELFEKYPDMFVRHEGRLQTYMYTWPGGWDDLVSQLIHDVASASDDVRILQIKEKFAGLRFYYSGGGEEVSKLVDKAERESYTTCQNCGSPEGAEVSRRGWVSTLCASCNDEITSRTNDDN